MFKATDLLGQFMQAGGTRSVPQRLGHAMGQGGAGNESNPLAALLGGLGGSAPAQGFGRTETPATGGQSTGGLAETASGLFGQATRSVQSGNPLAIGGLGALAGAFLGGGGKAMRGAVGGGAMALLGTLAVSALRNWQQNKALAQDPQAFAEAAPIGVRAPLSPAEEQELDQRSLLVVRAMINAAKADGEIDPEEIERILGQIDGAGTEAEARAFVAEEMRKPADLAGLVSAGGGNPELAVQVYAASLLAIEVDTQAEVAYLRMLAAGLGLEREVVERVHTGLNVPMP